MHPLPAGGAQHLTLENFANAHSYSHSTTARVSQHDEYAAAAGLVMC